MQNAVSKHHTPRGSAMLQWCIVALPLLLLGSMAIEASLWHSARQRLALAVQRATDDAALKAGTIEALQAQLRKHLTRGLDVPIKVCIDDPVNAMLADFMDKPLSRKLGKPVIRHDHLEAQHRAAIERGRYEGRGPRSRKTIYEANQLNVLAIIQYRALSPWLRKIVGSVTIRLEHTAIMQSHRQRLTKPCATLNSS